MGDSTRVVNKTNVILTNKWGLHAKCAFALAKEAMKFDSSITVEKEGQSADGKRVDDLLMLCAMCGDTIAISAKGPDEEKAIEKLAAFVGSKFGEE